MCFHLRTRGRLRNITEGYVWLLTSAHSHSSLQYVAKLCYNLYHDGLLAYSCPPHSLVRAAELARSHFRCLKFALKPTSAIGCLGELGQRAKPSANGLAKVRFLAFPARS